MSRRCLPASVGVCFRMLEAIRLSSFFHFFFFHIQSMILIDYTWNLLQRRKEKKQRERVKDVFVFRPVALYKGEAGGKCRRAKNSIQFVLTRRPNQWFRCTGICSLSVTTAVSHGDPCYVHCVLSIPWSDTITLFSVHNSVSLGKLAPWRGRTVNDP